jgi:hypothetical protein
MHDGGGDGRPAVTDEKAFDLRAATAREQRESRAAAELFEEAVKSGDLVAFAHTVNALNDEVVDGWRLAMKRVARLPGTADEIRNEFLVYWIRQKGFYYKVPNYRVLAALRVLLPPYQSPRVKRRCGFTGAPIPKSISGAPTNSILQIIDGRDTPYDEDEVVVDPFRLGAVRLVRAVP